VSFFSSPFAAASGVFTTSTCWKLSGVAVTFRSTPGSTSAYTALGPSNVGSGSFPGHVSSSDLP